MKIKEIEIFFVKGIEHKRLKFYDPITGITNDLIVLIGENNTGKTTIVECIEYMINSIQGEKSEFNWDEATRRWRDTDISSKINMKIEFDGKEVEISSNSEGIIEVLNGDKNLFKEVSIYHLNKIGMILRSNRNDIIKKYDLERIGEIYKNNERISLICKKRIYELSDSDRELCNILKKCLLITDKSILIIDSIEKNLDDFMQQYLIKILLKKYSKNQIIITTRSMNIKCIIPFYSRYQLGRG